MILLEAQAIFLQDSATLTSNGGGGGEGSDRQQDGAPGLDGSRDSRAAAGGTGRADAGGTGGNGSSIDTLTGLGGGSQQRGGGGGGGGAGFIIIRLSNPGGFTPGDATVSPPATVVGLATARSQQKGVR